MKRLITSGIALLVIGAPAFGGTRAGVVVGPGSGLGEVSVIPDANAPDPGYVQEKAVALSSVRNLLDRDPKFLRKGVKLYKFTTFPVPVSDFLESDRTLLENCSPKPARFLSRSAKSGVANFLVVMDCPTNSDPKHQVAAVVGEKNSEVISIVINTDVIPVIDSSVERQSGRSN